MRTGCQLGWILASKIHQNLLLDGSWAVLWPSWAVLGRLGGLLRRLEEASKNDAKKKCTKIRQKVRLQASKGTCKLDYVGAARGMQLCLAARNPQLSRRRVPYEGNLTQKNYLQRVSAESECR